MKSSYPKRKLTPRQKLIRKQFTSQDEYNNTWLVIDHQSFKLELIDDADTRGIWGKQYASWRRDQLSIALDRMIHQYEQI